MLSLATRKELIDLLQDYSDVFAWSYQDMPGLDTNIVVHRLPLREECAPVKQKLRRNQAQNASEDQRGSEKVVRHGIP